MKYILKSDDGLYFRDIESNGARPFRGIPVYSSDISDAYHWPTIGQVRMGILFLVGYFNKVVGAPSSFKNRYSIEIPSDWKVFSFEKGVESQVDFDIQKYIERKHNLRKISKMYGSAARSIFDKLEQAEKLDEFQMMLVFRSKNVRLSIDREIESINALIKSIGFKRTEMRKSSSWDQLAIAFKNRDDAIAVKLAYEGSCKLHIIDMESIKEVYVGTDGKIDNSQ